MLVAVFILVYLFKHGNKVSEGLETMPVVTSINEEYKMTGILFILDILFILERARSDIAYFVSNISMLSGSKLLN